MFCARRVRRTVGPLAVGAALAFLTAAPSVTAAPKESASRSCPHADTLVGHTSVPVLNRAVICLIDRERARWRLPALREDARLDRAAQRFADELVRSRSFAHRDTRARVAASGYHGASVGENIASGYLTPSTVVQAWMASKDHCRNILDPGFRNAGIGVTDRPVRGAASRPATWAVDFARHVGQRPASDNASAAASCPH
jgi:uncharacterized protein YkwD